MDRTRWANAEAVKRRQELRRSNAAQPIPAAKHKIPRSRVKQELKREIR